ncbi:MAG: hypothetical protein JWQ71_427, partial [Pedosphaera sp.]|nr:hypothetical protein [Pedosphaera sp.]
RYATGLFLIAGCAHHQGSTSLQPRAGAATLTTNQVIQIAKGAVAKNDNWAERATYDASHETNGWSVMVWRIVGYDQNGKPLFVPGGHRLIQIDDQGQIKNYFRGE